MLRLPGARRIGVLRASALGDFVFALPALAALRAAYPEAEIVLLGRAWHRDLLAGRPGPVDRVEPLPEGTVGDERVELAPSERADVLARLRRERFDIAIQLHGGGRNSNRMVRGLDARLTVGTATPDAQALDRVIPYVYWQDEVARCLEVVALVGAEPVTLGPRLAVLDDDVARSLAVLPDDGRPLAILHPGATDPRRRWPTERFADVARRLTTDGFRVAVTGTAVEADLGRSIASDAPDAVDAIGRLDLRALVGLLARAAVVVANDTGPLHLANAVGTPTVGIFWAGNAINSAPPFRAHHRPLLSWRLDCPACGVNCIEGRCAHDASFVDRVAVGDVLAAVGELLAGGPAARDRPAACRHPDDRRARPAARKRTVRQRLTAPSARP